MVPSHEDALQKIREEFQRFPLDAPARKGQHWTLMPGESPEMLAHALLYLCESMKIDRAAVEGNFARYAPFAATERLLMALVKAGADRQVMHDVIREHALKAWAGVSAGRSNPLADSLCADSRVTQYLAVDVARALLNANLYLGDSPERARWVASRIQSAI